MIKEMINQVAEFHKAFGVEKGNVDVELRYKLFKEEFEEYVDGYKAKLQGLEYFTTKQGKKAHTLTYLADAICDMLFIASGTYDVHRFKLNYNIDFDNLYTDEEMAITLLSSINEMYLDQEFIDDIMHDYYFNIFSLAEINGFLEKLPELFTEVFNSNMSKLDNNGKPIINELNSPYYDARKPIGKILKSDNFFEPNLRAILENKK